MKKLLLIAILMLALVITAVACTGDKNPEDTTIGDTTVETPTEAPTVEPDDPTEAPTAEPDDPTEAPTVEPEDPTEEPTDKPETPTDKPEDPTEEQTTADPMEPVNVFDAEALNTLTGANEVESTEVVNGYLHIVPKGPDPYWYPFANVKGARYVVIRYRTADAVGADVQLYIGSHGTAPVDDGSMLRQPAIVDGEWHLAIFDTQSLIDAGIYNGQHVSFFRLDPIEAGYKLDENGQPYKPDGLAYARYELPEGCSVDVSYVAFFHSIEAAEAYELKVNPPYVEPDAAGKVNHSFDTFYVNGQMYFPEDGGAGDKLAAQNNTVTFGMDDLCDSMMLRGWIGFTQPIASFGYYIDSYKMIYKDFATATEDGVKAAGGEHASRFEILVPLAELDCGVHTVGFVAMLEDGTVVRLREELKVVIVPYHKDETLILGLRDPAGAPFSGAPDMKFGQRGQIGENILKKVTIMDLATYADGNTNTWSFKVWQWNTDYATTVAGEPLFAITGENHQDNATFVMDIPVELFIGGDIYYEIEYLTGSGCFTAWPATDVVAGLETYVNGQLKEGAFAATITVGVKAERPENPDEETIIDVSGEGSTQVVFGEIYEDADKGTLFDGNLHIEKNLGPAYFDGVRTNDWMEFKINVKTAGDYNVCMVFGWLDHTGVYTILVDGAEAGKIVNTIPGTDWRAWGDSSPVKINLTEGEHTVRVIMGSDGPNVYGVKFTYVEPMPESIALNKPISADSVEKPQHEAIYANDGDENTRWCGLPKGEANLILDLEAVYTLDKIYLLLENAMGDFTISVSENGEDYTEVCACEGKPMSPVAFTLDFDLNGATGRYIKITRSAVDDNVDYWFSIYELYVYPVQ